MIGRQRAVKAILWMLVGALGVVSVARFTRGLGATTGLTDATPWGLWIAFDVMAGVALAAGGFVLAAAVYIFRLEQYRPFVRPAILTALLGYMAVAVGLLYDLGLPWHIWYPLIHPQHHSVLFEVAMCVMLYLGVLSLEFGPVVLEHPLFRAPLLRKVHAGLKQAVIPLVIAGIALSTLHQSSLGSLFLIAPHRVHPLWYSPIIWVLFFISAVGLGLMMVALESFFSAWFFGHKPRAQLLAGLGKAASIVLFAYAGMRIGDLALRGKLGLALDGSPLSVLFVLEILVSALVPATLLALPRLRTRLPWMAAASVMTVLGVIGYRFNVCIVAFSRPPGMAYFPSWMEVAVSLGIVAAAMLVFIFFVEHLEVYPREAESEPTVAPARPAFSENGLRLLLPPALSSPRRNSLAALMGAAVAVALLPQDAISGPAPVSVPVFEARSLPGLATPRAHVPGTTYTLVESEAAFGQGATVPLMVIDGNRDGRSVLFPHEVHERDLGAEDSCRLCHHQELPFRRHSACHRCHRDMYSATDIFNHPSHVEKLGGNEGCTRCHGADAPKTRLSSRPCLDCHIEMLVKGSCVAPPEQGMDGMAPGYMHAMHGLCQRCHKQRQLEDPARYAPGLGQCGCCHRDTKGLPALHLGPYSTEPGL